MERQTWLREITPLLDRLADRDEAVVRGALGVVRKVLPSYDSVSDEALVASGLRNSASVQLTLRARRLPADNQLWEAAAAARVRAEQGVPVQDVLTAHRISLHHIREFLAEAATAGECSPTVTVEMIQLVWTLADAVGLRMAIVHRETELEMARHDERQRAEFLRGLVFGSVAPGEIRRLAPAYQLAADRQYLVLRGRPLEGATPVDLVRALSAPVRGSTQRAFVDVLEGDVVGVAPRLPDLGGCPAVVGVGPAAELGALEASFATASRVLDVAQRFGRPGIFRLEDLSLRVAVAAEDELGALLVRRYLGPLQALGARAHGVAETIGAYLEHGLSVKATARALAVHENTVRYRLARFEEAVGVSLGDLPTAFEVWWAVQRAALGEPLQSSAAMEARNSVT